MLAKLIMSTLFGLLYGCLGLLAFAVTDVPDAPRMALVVGLQTLISLNAIISPATKADSRVTGLPLQRMQALTILLIQDSNPVVSMQVQESLRET